MLEMAQNKTRATFRIDTGFRFYGRSHESQLWSDGRNSPSVRPYPILRPDLSLLCVLQGAARSLGDSAILRSDPGGTAATRARHGESVRRWTRSTSSATDNLFRGRHANGAHDRTVTIHTRRFSRGARSLAVARMDNGGE